MIEYHVDTCELFQEMMNKESSFGGERSVKFSENEPMLIMIGHNEVIFRQFLVPKKSWIGPNGIQGLAPKDDGLGIMISGLQCPEFGFGYELNKEQLIKIKISSTNDRNIKTSRQQDQTR